MNNETIALLIVGLVLAVGVLQAFQLIGLQSQVQGLQLRLSLATAAPAAAGGYAPAASAAPAPRASVPAAPAQVGGC